MASKVGAKVSAQRRGWESPFCCSFHFPLLFSKHLQQKGDWPGYPAHTTFALSKSNRSPIQTFPTMKKNSESACAAACFLLMALFVVAFASVFNDLFSTLSNGLSEAYSHLPWK